MANSVVQDQRKRSLEALERGFAVEHLLRQKKNKKSLNVGDVREPSVRGSFLNGSSTDITDAVVSPSLDGSSEKVHSRSGIKFSLIGQRSHWKNRKVRANKKKNKKRKGGTGPKVIDVDVIQACGGQMTADGRPFRTGGGILWSIVKAKEPKAYKEIMKKAREFEMDPWSHFRPTINLSTQNPMLNKYLFIIG